jgi:hypothetical protein
MNISRRNFLSIAGVGGYAALSPFTARGRQAPPTNGQEFNWPANQALPTINQPFHLDVADLTKLTGDQQALLTTLQGVVNRQEPRLYWLLSGDGTDGTWLENLRVPYTTASDPWGLLPRYRHEISGAVVYDPDVPDTIDVATSLASLKNAVIATADLASSLNLPIVADLRGQFATKFDAYNWALAHLWPHLTHRILTGISPSSAVAIPGVQWTTLLEVTGHVHDASNKATYTVDLSPFLGGDGVFVRFQDAFSDDGWGPSVQQVTVTANGNVIASFQPGTSAEQPFLYEPDSSSLASGWRFADNTTYFIYRFAPPAGTTSLSMQVLMWNQYLVTATNTTPIQHVAFPNFRDYIVATGALVFWLDPLVSAEASLFAQILGMVGPDTPYLGWFVGGHEADGVTLCSQHGAPVLAADFFNNATVFAGVRADVRPSQPVVQSPGLQNKVYVTLTMSEGDNVQYDQHRLRQIWDDPNRGKVPLNWSINPLLLDAGPAMLDYYQETQSPNDFMVAGPSGAGYTYPGDWPSADLPSFTERSGRYMQRTGMNVIYALNRVSNTDIAMTDAVAYQYIQDVNPLGILYNWESTSSLSTPSGLPVITQVGISTVAQGQAALASAIQGWNGSSPLFVALGVLAWNMTPTDVNTLVASLGSQYEVVRADVFFELLRNSLGKT